MDLCGERRRSRASIPKNPTRSSRRWRLPITIVIVIGLTLSWGLQAGADLLPAGFSQTLVPGLGLNPTAIRVAPDGRVLVLEHVDTGPNTGTGTIRVVENGVALATPMLSIPVERGGNQEGLQDVAFHPDFPATPYLYVSYTSATPEPHNRVSRWLVSGNSAIGSEEVIFELPAYPGTTDVHFGGSMVFGSDGKLYLATGDYQDATLVQRFDTLFGKVLRLNDDGTVPTDNPFYTTLTNDFRAIYALGFRNPWKMAHDPVTGAIHIQDVGPANWEEVNVLAAGANYGWPVVEGPGGGGTYTDPLRAFNHESGTPFACAIVGGDFYRPDNATFPADYVGDYFVGEFCNSWIYRIDLATGDLIEFSDETEALPADRCSACGELLDLKVAPDGDLWQLRRISIGGQTETRLFRTEYIGNDAPVIGIHPVDVLTVAGANARFEVVAFGEAPLTYQWQRDQVDMPDETNRTLDLTAVQAGDDGAKFRVFVTNNLGSATSIEATLTVLAGNAPTGSIDTPSAGSTYQGGQTVSFSGSGSDIEDGVLPNTAYEWSVEFHHDAHTHPFITTLPDVTSGSFDVPDIGETETGVFYRINLILTDSDGAQSFHSTDVLPQISQITLQTDPPGLLLALDGQPGTSPLSTSAVVGVNRIFTAPLSQTVGTETYVFTGWSNNQSATQTTPAPPNNTTYTATYRPATEPPTDPFVPGHVVLDGDLGELIEATTGPFSAPSDIELVVNVALDDWRPPATQNIVGSHRAVLQLQALKGGKLKLIVKLNGATVRVKSVRHHYTDGEQVWLRAAYDATTGSVSFFDSTSKESDPALVGDWAQLGTTASATAGTVKSMSSLVIGRHKPGGNRPAMGRVFGAALRFDGTVKADVDFTDTADLTSTPPDYSQWGVWTLANASYVERQGAEGLGYLWFAGHSGDRAQINATHLPNATTVDARVRLSLSDWTPETAQAFMGANVNAVKFEVVPNGRLKYRVTTVNDQAQGTSSIAPAIQPDGIVWLRASYDAASGLITFYTSTDPEPDGENVTDWTQLGTPIQSGVVDDLATNMNSLILGGGNTKGGSAGYHPSVGRIFGGTLLENGSVVASIDFTTDAALTSIAPDYSGWGQWVVQGQLWQYIPGSI